MGKYNRTFTVIDLDKIKANFMSLKSVTADSAKSLAVIKADAYGHGSVECGKKLADVADYYAVATIDEAKELRQAGITHGILVLGYCEHDSFYDIVEYDITPVIFRYYDAYLLNMIASKYNKVVRVHLAIDTGMGRIGFLCNDEGVKEANKVFTLRNIYVEGIFSHFACADEENRNFTDEQSRRYDWFINKITDVSGIKYLHHSNSAGILMYKKYHRDMVRQGISLYGYMPSDETFNDEIELLPALSWYSHVTNIKTIEAGDGVSYGRTYVAEGPVKVATVSVGYADGYNRQLSNKGQVIINGHYAKILGRVCMDQIMVDITDIPDVEIENLVTLIGEDGDCKITADDMAKLCNTISYEILCNISPRVTRTFINE